jgi:DNA repair protein RecN (Recombination protein N)
LQASNEINFSSEEINALEERLFALKSLARKHRTMPENLPQVWREFEQKLQNLDKGEQNLAELMKDEKAAKEEYLKVAKDVSCLRKNDATVLDKKIMAELPDLKMEKARFVTEISPKEESSWSEFGIDEVCFKVSTNPNTPFGNLNKIASGGELARFMLALKVNLAQSSEVSTMIFDEIDTGIGGATAQAVGEKLAALGKNVQVMIVTHSPQVAALSSAHFKVEKTSADNKTYTTVKPLDGGQKAEEIARMLAGEKISNEARAAAKVLIGA